MAGTTSSPEKSPIRRVEEILHQEGLPASLEAERALLGAVLLNNDLLEEVMEKLEAEDFALPSHQRIYRTMLDMRMQSQPLDLVSLTEGLIKRGELEAVGGAEAVGEMISGVPRLHTVAHYVQIIQDRALLRQLIRRASRIINDAFSSTEEPRLILEEAEKSILEVGDRNLRSTLRGMSELAPQAAALLETLMERGEHVTGVSSKFTLLDEMTSGFQRSDFIILAARPSVGKTAFALSLALNVARQGKSVAFFSLEMSAEQLFFRLLSMASGVDLQKLRTGRIPKARQAEVALKIDELASLPIFIDDSPLATLLDMGAKLRRLKIQTPPEVVIIDYLQLMRGVGRFENRNQEVSAISRGLKALAKDLQVPVIALSQLSRAPEKRGEGKEPLLSDLRDSGSLEQDADLVLFLHRNVAPSQDDVEGRGKAKLIVAKQRNGPVGSFDITFLERQTLFANYIAGLTEGEGGG